MIKIDARTIVRIIAVVLGLIASTYTEYTFGKVIILLTMITSAEYLLKQSDL